MENKVLNTRIRLARNLRDFPFPPAMTYALSHQFLENMMLWVNTEGLSYDYKAIRLNALDLEDRLALFHRHLISSDFLENTLSRGLILSSDQTMSIMINEEDQLRIQVLKSGYHLLRALDEALAVHRQIEKAFDLAFHDRFGYLTACTTNVGTGMRASVQLHLPGIALSKDADHLIQSFTQLGIELRGTYGERSEVFGDVYQVSNRRTLGVSEEQIIRELDQVVGMLLKTENVARQRYILGEPLMEDKMYRAMGIIRYAKRLGYKEAFDLVSLVRLGSELSLKDFPDLLIIDDALEALKAQIAMHHIQHEDHLSASRATIMKRILFGEV
jgi:protein arginine kinase